MPPLRGALMRFRLRSDFTSDHLALPLFPAVLRRVDPARNMQRFYSLDVERDLFGNVVLVPAGDGSARPAGCAWISTQRRGGPLPR